MGGGGSYFPGRTDALRAVITKRRDADQKRVDADVNKLLQDLLARFNSRKPEEVNRQLDDIEGVLSQKAALDRILLGGSVAKHTYVDGLSDVDALVLFDSPRSKQISPDKLLDQMRRMLQDGLDPRTVGNIEAGELAVTVTYQDGSQIQLLPALRRGKQVAIPAEQTRGWREIDLATFQKSLTRSNERLNMALVPTIKLFKALNGTLPKDSQLSGYHIESLCLETTKSYKGATTYKALLLHVLSKAADRILKPIVDVTGQSSAVDEYLGAANSIARQRAANSILLMSRRLQSATSDAEWKLVFGE